MDKPFDSNRWLGELASETRDAYTRNRRVISFGEYMALFASRPLEQTRCAAHYLRDVFDFYGTETLRTARGEVRRFKMFDCPWDGGRDRLMGQEEVQGAVYRLISNFTHEGQTNRLILLHGPNGSAKSTFISCVQRAMEHYSAQEAGALYRFNWIFPVQKLVRGGIGFGGEREPEAVAMADSYANLEEDLIEAKMMDELRDHPLLLLPVARRKAIVNEILGDEMKRGFRPSRRVMEGDLSPRNRGIFEALLSSYHGDLARVLRHVQVERFYISRRYRQGVATVGPQLAVDAAARQLTVGRNLAGLPPALQALPLHEYQGELVDGNRGLIEFADLLKRPLDAFKYLLGTVEEGHVSLDAANLQIDTVFIASSNEGYLTAFKEIPEFQSFKGRMELVRAPYLLDYRVEQQIYAEHIRTAIAGDGERHVAPHLAWAAALWAVLTRMRKPMIEKYPKTVAEMVGRLAPLDKALIYAGEEPPEGFTTEQVRELRAVREKIARESDSYPNYEGRSGASPREMKLLLMNAAQSDRYRCVSPFALFEELEELVRGVSIYEFLKQEPLSGGYHEHRKFIFQVRDRLIDRIDEELRSSMGLVEERRYLEQFAKYVTQVSYWVKGEKVPNPITRNEEAPSEDFLGEIERILDVGTGARRDDFRREVISKIGAWSIDHPRERPDFEAIFPRHIERLESAFYNEHKKVVRKINEDMIVYLSEGAEVLERKTNCESVDTVKRTLENLKSRHGYCEECVRDAALVLVKKRYMA
jgi:predicted Ser/Thr protein kinase